MRDKGSYSGDLATPVQPDTPERMSAKYVRLMATRFLAGNAGPGELDDAVCDWSRTRREQAGKLVFPSEVARD